MTTAELIKKREEEQNKPLQENQPAANPFGGMSMAEARMAGNDDSQTQPVADTDNKPSNSTPLYDAGVKLGNLGNTEKELKGQSPISTPEYEKFRNEVIGAQLFDVETEEQKKARERRDFIKQGLTGFTEGLSALANLYYTTKGAPSQKQVSQMPELSKRLYAERLERDKKLENFRAWQRNQAEKKEERAYQDKVRGEELAFREKQARENLRRWELEFEEAKKRNATQAEIQRIELAMKQAQQEYDNAYKEKTLAETKRHNQAMESTAAIKASGSTTGSKKSTKMATINTPKGAMDVDFGRVNETTLNQLYQRVPDEVKEMYKADVLDDDKVRQSKMRQAIDHALQSSEGFSDWFEIAGLGSYQKVPESIAKPKEEKEAVKDSAYYSKFKVNGGANTQAAKPTAAATASTQTAASNVNVAATAKEEPIQQEANVALSGNKYEQMLAKDKSQQEKDNAERQKRIDDALAKNAKTLEEAKAKRAELEGLLNGELAEFDIEKFIKDNGIGVWKARKYRMAYEDDNHKRAEIKRELERLNALIDNR